MLRRSDGVTIDGKPTGLSKRIYLSSAQRENFGQLLLCDSTWILKDKNASHELEEFVSPIATGHSK